VIQVLVYYNLPILPEGMLGYFLAACLPKPAQFHPYAHSSCWLLGNTAARKQLVSTRPRHQSGTSPTPQIIS